MQVFALAIDVNGVHGSRGRRQPDEKVILPQMYQIVVGSHERGAEMLSVLLLLAQLLERLTNFKQVSTAKVLQWSEERHVGEVGCELVVGQKGEHPLLEGGRGVALHQGLAQPLVHCLGFLFVFQSMGVVTPVVDVIHDLFGRSVVGEKALFDNCECRGRGCSGRSGGGGNGGGG